MLEIAGYDISAIEQELIIDEKYVPCRSLSVGVVQ
jgi:hypothetical protein